MSNIKTVHYNEHNESRQNRGELILPSQRLPYPPTTLTIIQRLGEVVDLSCGKGKGWVLEEGRARGRGHLDVDDLTVVDNIPNLAGMLSVDIHLLIRSGEIQNVTSGDASNDTMLLQCEDKQRSGNSHRRIGECLKTFL
ncbi:hypothetical protein J6590_075096 [Homalodisca vitripennis]|nr:hypothetical protein J6590_075096 [Homalodisca vitripennis]